jgi:hypothetical protein
LRDELVKNAQSEVKHMGWEAPAIKCKEISQEAHEKFGKHRSGHNHNHART